MSDGIGQGRGRIQGQKSEARGRIPSKEAAGKKELDKKRALALLTAKDDADPSRVTKRKERHSELGKAKRLNAKQNLSDLLDQIGEL
ncbi:unnamed protein product [Jaminaea pallidilutea]